MDFSWVFLFLASVHICGHVGCIETRGGTEGRYAGPEAIKLDVAKKPSVRYFDSKDVTVDGLNFKGYEPKLNVNVTAVLHSSSTLLNIEAPRRLKNVQISDQEGVNLLVITTSGYGCESLFFEFRDLTYANITKGAFESRIEELKLPEGAQTTEESQSITAFDLENTSMNSLRIIKDSFSGISSVSYNLKTPVRTVRSNGTVIWFGSDGTCSLVETFSDGKETLLKILVKTVLLAGQKPDETYAMYFITTGDNKWRRMYEQEFDERLENMKVEGVEGSNGSIELEDTFSVLQLTHVVE
ncbi:signal peptide containing protein [Theileria equi strain WA]|uniref:Signal peptide containing protein n=1 Tax=Theileria equi strain WA TaxID=1537102 RepID=L1LAG9_THEEQ|nr:signal peptide containing protein [Theileria equi strain WA]EKX72168.1 signal peptide containing protein [Theileria equi strain WA]|eukprot:XP_004831620.1 signal peptide containing protein [Theileria equi strain WA]